MMPAGYYGDTLVIYFVSGSIGGGRIVFWGTSSGSHLVEEMATTS